MRPHFLSIQLLFLMTLLGHTCVNASNPIGEHSEFHDHEAIRNTVRQYVQTQVTLSSEEKLEIRVGSIDNRLKLKRCDDALHPFRPSKLTSDSMSLVGVRCDGPIKWKLFVSVSKSIFTPVIVAARPIAKNQILTGDDFKTAIVNKQLIHGAYYNDKTALIDKRARRFISEKSIIKPQFISKRQLVKRGEHVIILATTGYLTVKTKGIALGSGAKDEHVRVKNLSSERVVDAVVIRSGHVKVRL